MAASHTHTQGSNPESARAVESLSVNTPKYGEQRLDAEPDKRLVRVQQLACMRPSSHISTHAQPLLFAAVSRRAQTLSLCPLIGHACMHGSLMQVVDLV